MSERRDGARAINRTSKWASHGARSRRAHISGDAGNGAYKIGPSDVLDISVFQVPELTKSVQVSESGTVNLPLVGEISVAGQSAQEVERDLTARLGAKYVKNPQVTVYVKEYNSSRVTITGAVSNPGVFPIKGNTSLVQVVAMAGGLGDASDSDGACDKTKQWKALGCEVRCKRHSERGGGRSHTSTR